MAGKLVSVIMPCFNAGRMLRRALTSVVEQTHPDLEIIFVDNNSTDGSLEVARRMAAESARPFRLLSCPEQGVNRARNLGFAAAQGDYIQWMDADDELAPDKIALQVAALAQGNADIAYGDWTERWHIAGGPPQLKPHHERQESDQLLRNLCGKWYPPLLHLLTRGAAARLDALGAWHPARPVATDKEYFAVAALLGLRWRHVAGAHVTYNVWSDEQMSGGTNYAVRVAALRDIFRRLLQMAGEPWCEVRLSARHQAILDLGWDVWRIRRGALTVSKLGGRLFRLHNATTSRSVDGRPRDVTVAQAMQASAVRRAVLHHAIILADGTIPELADKHLAMIETVERFRRAGLLELVERVAPAA